MQLNSIPVFVYNGEWFPFDKFIDWNEFSVIVQEDKINTLKDKLKKYSNEDKKRMLKKGKEIYNEYFTMEGMSKNILRYLKNEK